MNFMSSRSETAMPTCVTANCVRVGCDGSNVVDLFDFMCAFRVCVVFESYDV